MVSCSAFRTCPLATELMLLHGAGMAVTSPSADHLDTPSIKLLHKRFGDALAW